MRHLSSRRRVAVIALSTALLSPLAVAPALAAPASAAPATASPALSSTVITPGREIGLAGTTNTRTLEGYRGAAGKQVNGLVLRSDNLSKLTASDVAKLQGRGLATIVDLRTDIERTLQPNKAVPGARQVTTDVLGKVSPLTLVDVSSAYPAFVTDANARTQIRKALLEIKTTAASGKTTLFHCSAGKDRTGWTAATLLTILGVDRATIDADYLASNHYRNASPNDPFNGVNISMLNSAFAAANRVYGSMDGYLTKGLGLTQADISSLRTSLLQN
ncbi:tyrosine-protein phosphatase [Gordonia neofelifaecis]|uniref:Protein tyrosine/serine phosphatase-like protein n=1 Tax=Gordonia neofelifaecis NRRL B-59395 TaxID=644548 RepID=F1YMW8_9ACTN|nr:tyrosine-protein phosphatase [Gordonia neofelifaecis]EGD54053.1 Protein tyrosine/serine phosphatase-like protein [Gordonia neofelifaecis NRRL B-59395]